MKGCLIRIRNAVLVIVGLIFTIAIISEAVDPSPARPAAATIVVTVVITATPEPAAVAANNTSIVSTEMVDTPTETIAVPDSTPTLAWWEGGTLHSSTVAEWRAADQRNRRATAADWAASGFDLHTLRDIEFYANELLACIDTALDAYETAYGADGSMIDMAATCALLIKEG